MKPARQEYDFALRRYLEREHSLCVSVNSTDYKPTYKDELDSITKEAIRNFERACELLDKLSTDQRDECRRVYELANPRVSSYEIDDLASFFIENRDPAYKSRYGDKMKFVDLVGPRWLSAYLTYCDLHKLFRPDAPALPLATGRHGREVAA